MVKSDTNKLAKISEYMQIKIPQNQSLISKITWQWIYSQNNYIDRDDLE